MTANTAAYLDLTPVGFMRRPPDHRIVVTVILASVLAVDLLHARPTQTESAPTPAVSTPVPASSFAPAFSPSVSLA